MSCHREILLKLRPTAPYDSMAEDQDDVFSTDVRQSPEVSLTTFVTSHAGIIINHLPYSCP